jgi:predicted RND superfamily exporter protein
MRARRALSWLADRIVAHSGRFLVGAAAVGLFSLALLPGLRVDAGHSGLVDAGNEHQRRFDTFLERFGSPSMLFVMVEGGDVGLRRRVVGELQSRLPAEAPRGGQAKATGASAGCRADGTDNHRGCVKDVLARLELAQLKRYAPLYMPADKLRGLVDALASDELDIAPLLRSGDLGSAFAALAELVEAQAERAPVANDEADGGKAVLLFNGIIQRLARRVEQGEGAPPLLGDLGQQLAGAGTSASSGSGVDAQGYLVSRDGGIHLAIVRPIDDSDNPDIVVPFVDYVESVAKRLVQRIGAPCAAGEHTCSDGPLRVRLTGLPALTAAEKKGLSRDLALTTALAIGGILALFIFGFRSIPQGLLGLAPLVVALLATLAFVRLAFGSLNMLTTAFIPTVLGLGIDFSVHLLSRFNEGRRSGKSATEAVRASVLGCGPAMVTGALTTAGAFLALAACDFKGFAQLGLITCVGLLFALVATLVITSSMLALPRLSRLQAAPPPPYLGSAPRVARLVARHRWIVIGAGLCVTGLMVWRASRIPWSYNYLDLLPRGVPAVEAMTELARRTEFSGEVAAMTAPSSEQARRVVAALRQKETVGRVEALPALVPESQAEKRAQLRRLGPLFSRVGELPQLEREVDLKTTSRGVQALLDVLQDLRFEARRAGRSEVELLDQPIDSLQRLQKAMTQTQRARVRHRLSSAQAELLGLLQEGYRALHSSVSAPPLTEKRLLEILPTSLHQRLYREGNYAIYVYPRGSLWSGDFLQRFVSELRQVDSEVTGFPVTYWETNLAIEDGFRRASIYACIALLLLLLADFRSLRYTGFALLPLALGVAWMWGSMSVLGMSYNFANIIAFPLIIGIGVASGVHILHRYKQEGERDIIPVIEHTGLAILLSAATTMVGFGSLSLASHRGAASLGQVLLIGVGACLATSTLLLPALLHVLPSSDNPPSKGQRSR